MSFRPDVAHPTERRGNKPPIPPDIDTMLNPQQALALRQIENFGWRLAFVRQVVFEEPVTVVVSPDRQRYGVIEIDGGVNMHPDITLRG